MFHRMKTFRIGNSLLSKAFKNLKSKCYLRVKARFYQRETDLFQLSKANHKNKCQYQKKVHPK